MNIKLPTPKSLKTGSGMASMKQFLLSIVATSISIALTFGTAAIIERNKKQSEKRQIVMMVMYDMYNSLESVEKADSMLHQIMDFQLKVAEKPSLYEKYRFYVALRQPKIEYTETTERIFSSNIETINTVGNVLFTESVAEFYQNRQLYKTSVCDSVSNMMTANPPVGSLKALLDSDFSMCAIMSSGILYDMQQLYAQSKEMMEVTDEEVDAYRKKREQIDKKQAEEDKASKIDPNKIIEMQMSIEEKKSKIKY